MLKMTDEQRYDAVLKELGEVLQSKNTTISCQAWQIDQLKEKLAAAEEARDEAVKDCEMSEKLLAAEREEAQKMRAARLEEMLAARECTEVRAKDNDNEMFLVLNSEAVVALRAINAELREIYNEYGCSSCASELKALQKAIASVLPIEGGAA